MELDFNAVTAFIAAHREWTILVIFLVSFGESFAFVSLVIPGTTILAACGAMVPSGVLSAWALMAGAIPGAVFGDAVSYWLGRRYGIALIQCWPLSRHPKVVERGERFLARHGMASVAIGRFFGPVRAVIPLLAGMARMDRRVFWLANVLSSLVWAPAVMLPGVILAWATATYGIEPWWMVLAAGGAVMVLAASLAVRRAITQRAA